MIEKIGFLVICIYILCLLLITAFSSKIRGKFKDINETINLLSGFTILAAVMFFTFEYIKYKQDSLTQKQTATLEYLVSLEDDKTFEAKTDSESMLSATIMYRDNPKTEMFDPNSGIEGDWDNHFNNYIITHGKTLKKYRERVKICIEKDLCDDDITKDIYCPHIRAYMYTVITHRQRFIQECIQKTNPNLTSISVDDTYEFSIDYCQIDKDEISKFDKPFLENIGNSFCDELK